MNRNHVLPQVHLPDDLNALRRVDFCAPQSYEGGGFLPISALPRLEEGVCVVRDGDGFEWQVETYFEDSPGSQARHLMDLRLKGRVHLLCQRCLQDCAVELAEKRQFILMATEEEADAFPMEDDRYEPLVANQHFDLLAAIEDELLLSLPLIPKHPDGQCVAHSTVFGDSGAVSQAVEKSDNPFNVLKNIKKISSR